MSNAAHQPVPTLDHVLDGLMLTDPRGAILYLDPAMSRMLSLDPGVPPDLPSLAARFRWTDGNTTEGVLKALAENGRWEGALVGHTRNGVPCSFELRATQIRDAAGYPLAALFAARESDRERAFEKQILLGQQMVLLENLSGGITHEFRNLLTIIVAYASLLRERVEHSDLHPDIVRIQDAAQAANELAGRLGYLIRPHPVSLEAVDVKELLRDVEALLRKGLPRNIALTVADVPEDLRARTDRQVLCRALLHLGLNARDAMSEGGQLTLAAQPAQLGPGEACPNALPGPYIALAVTDTGHGVAPQDSENIFLPFYSTRPGHAGMGLSMVWHSLRAMRGWVSFDSEPGRGSCFRLFVPVADQTAPVTDIEDEPPGPTGSEHLLVVDDDPLALSITSRLLQKAGYKVTAATGGEEALELYKQRGRDFDLILLDVVMPYLSGEDVYREIVRINPSVRILLISGFTPQSAKRLLKISGARLLAKPLSQGALARAVREALDGPPPGGG